MALDDRSDVVCVASSFAENKNIRYQKELKTWGKGTKIYRLKIFKNKYKGLQFRSKVQNYVEKSALPWRQICFVISE